MRLLFFLLIILCLMCSCGNHEQNPNGIFCSAEKVKKVGSVEFFVMNGSQFGNGKSQSKEESKTGSYSCKVTSQEPYGFDYLIDTLKPGDRVIATVWRKGKGGVLAIKNELNYYKQTKEVAAVEGEWEQLRLEYLINDYNYNQQYLIHCWLANKDELAYFDDLEIQVIRQKQLKAYIPEGAPVLNIKLKKQALEHLKNKREEAIEAGLIISTKDSKVPAEISVGPRKWLGKIRLKGDMIDHIRGRKWSFRIELEKGESWQGMNKFSIQNPMTRSYLDEWYFHEMLKREEILSPKYGFVFVVLNSDTLGLYAYEEHFAPALLKSQNRKIAPILKFDEDKMWQIRQQNDMQDIQGLPVYETAEVKIFSGTRNTEYTKLAINKMRSYQYGESPAIGIINPKKTGAYLAVLDLCKAYHALIWHNQRWYFNPIKDQLEPIGYDGYTHTGPFDWVETPFLGHMFYKNEKLNKEEITMLLYDSLVYENYINTLKKITTQNYISQFIKETDRQWKEFEQWIKIEYPEYSYNKQLLFQQGNAIRSLMPLEKVDFSETNKKIIQFNEEMPFYPDLLFKVIQKQDEIIITSFYSEPVLVIGLSTNSDVVEEDLWIPIKEYSIRKKPLPVKLANDKTYSYVFIKDLKHEKIVSLKIE